MTMTLMDKLLLTCAACAWPVLAAAQYEGYSTTRLLTELGEVMSQARSAESQIKASLARRDQFARELQDINRERDNYQRDNRRYQADLASHNDAVDRFNDECKGGTYSQQELARCETRQAELESTQTTLNARRDELEEARLAVRQRMEDYNRREQERAHSAEAELARYDELNASISAMLEQLRGKTEFAGSPCFTRSSPEAAHQCLVQAINNRRQ